MPVTAQSMRHFLLIVLGQTVSVFGSQLTSFVLGVWIYQRSGSATQFSLIIFFALVPQLLVLPTVGVLIDRWDRRRAMIFGDIGSGACTLIIFALVSTNSLEVVYLYPLVALSSFFSAFQGPALAASTVLMVPSKHLVRANGVVEIGQGLAFMLAPMVAAFLLDTISLKGVILVDVATFLFAVGTLLVVHVPRPQPRASEDPEPTEKPSILREATFGWHYIRQRPGLLALLILFAGVNFTQGMVQVLLTPLVLSFATAVELGQVLSTAIFGTVVGGVVLTVFGGPKRCMPAIFLAIGIQGAILFLGGLEPSVLLVTVAATGFMVCQPVILACSRTLWQTRVAPDIQGRVFAIRRLVSMSAMPFAFLLAGPLADHVFEPAMAPGGALASALGPWIGTGPGRGIGLLFIVLGLSVLVILVLAVAYRPLRRLEDEIPEISVQPTPPVPDTRAPDREVTDREVTAPETA